MFAGAGPVPVRNPNGGNALSPQNDGTYVCNMVVMPCNGGRAQGPPLHVIPCMIP